MAKEKNGKCFKLGGMSFNEISVAGKTLPEWLKYGKETYKGRPFFGKRDEAQQDELLTEVHKIATAMVNGKPLDTAPAGETEAPRGKGK